MAIYIYIYIYKYIYIYIWFECWIFKRSLSTTLRIFKFKRNNDTHLVGRPFHPKNCQPLKICVLCRIAGVLLTSVHCIHFRGWQGRRSGAALPGDVIYICRVCVSLCVLHICSRYQFFYLGFSGCAGF